MSAEYEKHADKDLRISELYKRNKRVISVEFFPPNKLENLPATKAVITELKKLPIEYMTVTYGAGGSTQGFTAELVRFIHEELKTIVAAHLTCMGHAQGEIDDILNSLGKLGIQNIVALRGDPKGGASEFIAAKDGFSCARDLTKHITKNFNFCVAVAGYPEGHKDAKSMEADLQYLKEKVDAGAEVILTQLFLDSDFYFKFVERARKIGITIPIVPGIMPISDVAQLQKFTSMCGTSIPSKLKVDLDKIADNKSEVIKYGTHQAIELSKELLKGGAPGIHLYSLNKSAQVKDIITNL